VRFEWGSARTFVAGLGFVPLCVLLPLLEGCAAPVAIAVGAAHVAVIANDPRTTATQLDDQATEFKVTSEAGTRYGNDIHLNVTSYNGVVLLTGEVPSTVIQDEITKLAKAQDNVKLVQNEMVIAPVTDLGARTNDTFITSKVKTRLLEDDQYGAIYIKVVTERSVVYLMGMLSRPIGESAAQTAATTDGVAKVVKVFEYTR
jgi:osmotically-inducible protein OsmY